MDAVLKAPKASIVQRINPRMIVFLLVIGCLIGYPLYIFIDAAVSGGIKDAGGGYKEVDLKAMSLFWFDQQHGTLQDIPAKWRALDGQKVIVFGEMWAANYAGNDVSNYDLCYSIAKCCFQGPPQVQHFVKSKPQPNARLNYYPGLVKVKGVLHVNVKQGPEKVESVYQMDVEEIEPVQ